MDAWAFEAAVESAAGLAPADAVCTLEPALRMWRGPAYADYVGEPWAEAEIARLTELRVVARERLVATRLELGEAQFVIASSRHSSTRTRSAMDAGAYSRFSACAAPAAVLAELRRAPTRYSPTR